MTHKVFIGVGHGGSDSGACAEGMAEKDVNLVVAISMEEELKRHGIQVALSRREDKEDRLQQEIDKCSGFAPTLAVEVHHNAGGGKGFEVYCQTNQFAKQSHAVAQCVEQRVKAIGQNSRGIKTRVERGVDYFGWLRECRCPSILCEGFFLDNQGDRELWGTPEKQKMLGCAYAQGVLDYLGVASQQIYRVQVGAFEQKENAEKLQKQFRDAGISALIR